MKTLILAAAAAVAIATFAIPASALPGIPTGPSAAPSSIVVPIRDGCGPRRYRNGRGYCVRY